MQKVNFWVSLIVNGVVDVGGEHFNAQSGPNALSAPVRRERQTVLTKICTSLIQKAAQFKHRHTVRAYRVPWYS